MAEAIRTRRLVWAHLPIWLVVPLLLGATPLAAQEPLTTQGSASKQPTLPKPMPDMTVPGSGAGGTPTQATTRSRRTTRHEGSRRYARHRGRIAPLERPALANVELVEPLPHPPQPPHVTVPVPGYPLDDFVTYFTMPPPPVVCRPTRYDRFKPDPGLVDERPVLCTADNP